MGPVKWIPRFCLTTFLDIRSCTLKDIVQPTIERNSRDCSLLPAVPLEAVTSGGELRILYAGEWKSRKVSFFSIFL